MISYVILIYQIFKKNIILFDELKIYFLKKYIKMHYQ